MPYFGVKINISPVLFSGKHGSRSGAANDYDVIVNRKIDSADKRVVLLRTCAVRVINPDTKKSKGCVTNWN